MFDDDDDGEKQVTIKPVAWSVGLFLPLAFLLSMCLGFMGIRGNMQPLIGIGLPFLGIVIGLIMLSSGISVLWGLSEALLTPSSQLFIVSAVW